jgi:hypothetical protein
VLALSAQQRALTPALRPSAASARILAARDQHVEAHALRAEAALRVAPVPVLARVPWFPVAIAARSWPAVELAVAAEAGGQVARGHSHFHSKRRIPRMNSEEPPRV